MAGTPGSTTAGSKSLRAEQRGAALFTIAGGEVPACGSQGGNREKAVQNLWECFVVPLDPGMDPRAPLPTSMATAGISQQRHRPAARKEECVKAMNVGDWITPSAQGKGCCWHTEEVGPNAFRRWGFYDDMIGVVIGRDWCTHSSVWEYTVMWTNTWGGSWCRIGALRASRSMCSWEPPQRRAKNTGLRLARLQNVTNTDIMNQVE